MRFDLRRGVSSSMAMTMPMSIGLSYDRTPMSIGLSYGSQSTDIPSLKIVMHNYAPCPHQPRAENFSSFTAGGEGNQQRRMHPHPVTTHSGAIVHKISTRENDVNGESAGEDSGPHSCP